jgi:hypothetical protein
MRRLFYVYTKRPMSCLRAALFISGALVTTHDDMQANIAENEQRIAVHEAVCAQRYQGIQDSFDRGERRMKSMDERSERMEKKSARMEYILYFLLLVAIGGKDVAVRLAELVLK